MKSPVLLVSLFLVVVGGMVYYATLPVPPKKVASVSSELLSDAYVRDSVLSQDANFKEGETLYTFNNVTYKAPVDMLRQLAYKAAPSLAVLGATTENKRIVVDLAHQRVYAYEGNRVVFNFLVSTGYWGPTPPGQYKIWYKVRSQTMKGGDKAKGDYYYLPNVQFVQFFNKGISFHSTYWHNNFGNPMSHGCVNMTLTDAETLYYWANPEMPPGVRILRPTGENPGTQVDVMETWDI